MVARVLKKPATAAKKPATAAKRPAGAGREAPPGMSPREGPAADTVLGALAGYAGIEGFPKSVLLTLREQGYYNLEDICNFLSESQINEVRCWHTTSWRRLQQESTMSEHGDYYSLEATNPYIFSKDDESWAYVPFDNTRATLNARLAQ